MVFVFFLPACLPAAAAEVAGPLISFPLLRVMGLLGTHAARVNDLSFSP